MKLTHIDGEGKVDMVDISLKTETVRTATAYAEVSVSKKLFQQIRKNEIEKGDVLTVAKIAGIQAAKKTSELIPLCHNILISKIDLDLKLNSGNSTVEITSYAKTVSETGIEMEALTAVSVAALTVYDMCKAVDKSITVKEIKLLTKTGGKSGNYKRGK